MTGPSVEITGLAHLTVLKRHLEPVANEDCCCDANLLRFSTAPGHLNASYGVAKAKPPQVTQELGRGLAFDQAFAGADKLRGRRNGLCRVAASTGHADQQQL